MSRLALPETLTPEQQRACDEVVAGKRGKVPLPMVAWLRNPEMARRTQRLGELMRFETELGPALSELAIIICGRHWTAHVQWKAHKAYALQAGIDPQIADDIAARRVPAFKDDQQRLVYEVSTSLLTTSRVPADLYARALDGLGERKLAELAVLLGYYCIASFTLNTFEMGLPESAAPELQDPQYPAK